MTKQPKVEVYLWQEKYRDSRVSPHCDIYVDGKFKFGYSLLAEKRKNVILTLKVVYKNADIKQEVPPDTTLCDGLPSALNDHDFKIVMEALRGK